MANSPVQTKPAPLWLPAHERAVVAHAASRPPDYVQGYSLLSGARAAMTGSNEKTAVTVATALGMILYLSLLPTLIGPGIGAFVTLSIFSAWSLVLLLLATRRTRSISIGTAARYWLSGFFLVSMIAYFLTRPLENSLGENSVWVVPAVLELIKTVPLVIAVVVGRKKWRYPGVSDLMVIGFAVGSGHALHTAALWEQAPPSGFGGLIGLIVPSVSSFPAALVVGHAIWTALLGAAIGVLLLHRHHPLVLLAGACLPLVVLTDHMSMRSVDGPLAAVAKVLVGGRVTAFVFLLAIAGAVVLDHRRQAMTGQRDHLFPSPATGRNPIADPDEFDDVILPVLVGRYRRRRNGMYNTIDSVRHQWPPLAAVDPPPVAELAQLGRAADVGVGPGCSASGWVPESSSSDSFQFVNESGFTPYVAHGNEDWNEISVVPSHAYAETSGAKKYWQYAGLGLVAIALFGFVRLLTGQDPTPLSAEAGLVIGLAPESPALVRGVLGSLAALGSIVGRPSPTVGAAADVGPPDERSVSQPEEVG